ncbi:hypothetical protein EJ05DRAFT_517848 [Pseudovirgaria hyperparasitica]|uniref:Acyltransferase 3 domain-containing protein n=1 Tax=Pseudovirgaria hyperparasitica TaxID=470096 RepID=A0A6A6W371_9PEZI|nr:uncharacterized protein EJ05DRAFT_517848 [Pseudovirgaria hyperparasitica]KAF2756426.1 hypothetical protein EJ05DRAFT_517848 [Pseudovirgaria hyperparasitica]
MQCHPGYMLESIFHSNAPSSASITLRIVTGLSSILRAARPSFLSSHLYRPSTLRPTAYLDGLRGFAALLVYIQHHELWAHHDDSVKNLAAVFENAWGYDDNHYFAILPIVRILFCGGHVAVACFYVISGYVLTQKPLTYILSGEKERLGDNLASALFRRWLRLYLPIVGTTVVYFTGLHVTGVKGVMAKNVDSYWGQVRDFWTDFRQWSYLWRTADPPWLTYNMHTWSIPIELKGSIVVYILALSTSNFTRSSRWCVYAAMICYFLWMVDGWSNAYFVAGMALAEMDLHAAADDLPPMFRKLGKHKKKLFCTLFVLGLLLAGAPSNSFDMFYWNKSPGWSWVIDTRPAAMSDAKWWPLFFASTLIVMCIPRISVLKSFFESNFCQYLGRISYALYLLHGAILTTIAMRLYVATGFGKAGQDDVEFPGWYNRYPLSNAGPLGLEINFLACQVILLPSTLWAAELGTKFIDEPAVRFAQWIGIQSLAISGTYP